MVAGLGGRLGRQQLAIQAGQAGGGIRLIGALIALFKHENR